jgi:aarF domain-containing kinase
MLRRIFHTQKKLVNQIKRNNSTVKKSKKFRNGILATLVTIGGIGYLYPEQAQESKIGGLFQFLEGTSRLLLVSYHLSIIAADYKSLKSWDEIELVNKIHERSAKRVLEFCVKNGGVYIKAGQYIASLNHIIPKPYINVLSVLFNEAPFVDFESVKRIIEADFQKPFNQVFKEFEELPIAAASVAQVHKAITFDGQTVAVKVQYPKVRRCFEGDMFTHELIIWSISQLFPGWDFRWIGPEMHRALKAEMDFKYEANNAKITADHLKNNKNVFVPIPIEELSSERVLTTEFIDGCKPTDLKRLNEMGLSRRDVSQYICEAFSEQIFTHGFLHGDPHPGNSFIISN